MKKTLFPLGLISIFIFTCNIYSQTTSIVGENQHMYLSTDCSSGIVEDDGSSETGYGIICGYGYGRYVMKLTPGINGTSYPYKIDQICIGLTRMSNGGSNWSFSIDIFDTTGAGGSPGNLIDSFNVSAAGIPAFPSSTLYTFSNLSGIPTLTHGSYYIGIGFDPCAAGNQGQQYICSDISTNSTMHVGYVYIQGSWSTIISSFTNYKNLIVRAEQTSIGIHKISNEVPNEFRLYNNYPNPFNPTTSIKFDLPKSSYVKLVVYNMIGQFVCTLADGEFQAGIYSVGWDASNFSSGTYFYRIETAYFTDVKKMVLIK